MELSKSKKESLLVLITLLLLVAPACKAESLTFNNLGFAFDLPGSTNWNQAKKEKNSDKDTVFEVSTDDKALVGRVTVRDVFPATAAEQRAYLTTYSNGMKRWGFDDVLAQTLMRDDVPLIAAAFKGTGADGNEVLWTTMFIFANKRTYEVSTGLLKANPESARLSSEFMTGFRCLGPPSSRRSITARRNRSKYCPSH